MARIESLGGGLFRRNEKKKKPHGGKTGAAKAPARPFFEVLQEPDRMEQKSFVSAPESTVSEQELESLLDNVHSRGDQLKEHPSMERIKAYREAVASFLSYVVGHCFEAETTDGARFNPLKRQKRYTVIRHVNEKLEKLAAGVLANQFGQLDILRRVEEINGMLVNLLQ